MFFRHGIEKVPFLRDSLENISFEPSRHPSALDELPYRESFFDRIPNRLFRVECFLSKSKFSRRYGLNTGFLGIANKPLP